VNEIYERQRQKQYGVVLIVPKRLDKEEDRWRKSKDEGRKWQAQAIERFRRRWAVSEASVAHFALGGRPETQGGRPSGVVEETILSLALRRPIYLAGGFGGATEDIGALLGLSGIRTPKIPESLKNPMKKKRYAQLAEIADRLCPPPFTKLPVLPEDQVKFLQEHVVDGPKWPKNGLTPEDNRKLFSSTNPEEVKELVVQGLRRLFTPPPPALSLVPDTHR
jgi:hypothetical protein